MSPTPTSVRQILLVEDNPGDARLIAEYLDEAGAAEFVLTTHTRLADTLAHLAARPCDVLLLDLGLPDSEGLQTLLAVREAQPDLPVVVLTGEYDEGLGTAAVAAGAQDFVVKGRVDARGLAAALRYAAERQRWMSELDHVNRLLRAIRGVNQLISRETEPQRILQGTCASLVEHRGYLAAWIVWLGADDAVRGLAGTGLEDHLDALRAELEQGRSPACVRLVREDGTTLATGESPQLCADCPLPAPVRDASSMVAPLSFGGATYGALSVSMPRHVPPTEEEQGLFAEVAGDVAYALHALDQQAGRARAEAARQDSEQRFRTLFESAPDAIYLLDLADGAFVDGNTAAERIIGLPREELLGTSFLEAGLLDEDDLPKAAAIFQRNQAGEPSGPDELLLHRADGSTVPIEIRTFPLEVEGRPLCLGIARDITDRKLAEAAREQALTDARQHASETTALLKGSKAVQRHDRFDAAARAVFDACKAATGATAGYVALLDERGEENEVLFLDAGDRPCTVDPDLPMPVRGLRGEAYRTGEVVYDNGYAASEWARFMPPGHATIDNVLFAPIQTSGRVDGLLGLANKPGGFTDSDAHLAEGFAELAGLALRKSRAAEALRASEARYHSLFDEMITGFALHELVLDDDGRPADYRFLEANPEFERLTGLPVGDIVGRTAREVLPGIEPAWIERYGEVVRTGEAARFREYSAPLERHFDVLAYPHGSDQFATLFNDVTKEVRAEAKLRERSRELSERIKEMGCLLGVLRIMEEPGLGVHEALARGVTRLVDGWRYPELAVARIELGTEVVATPDFREPPHGMQADIRALGARIGRLTVGYRTTPAGRDAELFLAEEQQLLEALAAEIGRFVERRRADELLRESEEEYRAVFEHSNDAILIHDREGRILRVNGRACELLGRDAAALQTRRLAALYPEAEHAAASNAVAMTARHGHHRFETRFQRADGGEVAVEISSRVVAPETGLTQSVVRDISERKQAEREREEVEAQLRQAQRMESVGRLAGGIAHDFNNLLTAILGYCDLLQLDLPTGAPGREDVDEIRKASTRATSLTRQLLAFSRRQVLQPRLLDLNDTLADMDRMLRRLIGEDVDLVTALDPRLGAVRADPGQVEQVLMNLAVNARDAMPDGGKLTIETKNVELDEAYATHHVAVASGPYVLLAVSDTGHGMDETTRASIFEPFFTTKERGKGTGLGLSTVYGIVKQSGGNIWVYSEPGQGTTFKIYLPRAVGQTGTVPQPERAADRDALTGTETVLLIEDDLAVRGLAAQILERYGYTLLTAADGEEALYLAAAEAGRIDLVLTDVVMPGMSGRQVAEALLAERPDLKVLFMSGYTDNSIVHHGVLDEGMAFLQKPFTPEELGRKLREVLDGGSTGGE